MPSTWLCKLELPHDLRSDVRLPQAHDITDETTTMAVDHGKRTTDSVHLKVGEIRPSHSRFNRRKADLSLGCCNHHSWRAALPWEDRSAIKATQGLTLTD
jgi:hypothetical protein